MMVTANMTERNLNLVAPLDHKSTAMHIKDTAANMQAASCAVSDLIGKSHHDCATLASAVLGRGRSITVNLQKA